jgi:quinol monooxygenase YgiN
MVRRSVSAKISFQPLGSMCRFSGGNKSRMQGVIVIVAYRPKPGKARETLQLVRERVPALRREGLVTNRAPTIMRARDGSIIEVSEWKSKEAIEAAHRNPNVLAMWQKFFAVCDCVPLKTLAEAEEMFAGFEPLD